MNDSFMIHGGLGIMLSPTHNEASEHAVACAVIACDSFMNECAVIACDSFINTPHLPTPLFAPRPPRVLSKV